MSFSASDVFESSVPERQCFWCARLFGQVQRSRGEYSTFHPVSPFEKNNVIVVDPKTNPIPSSHRLIKAVMCSECPVHTG